MTYKFYMHNPSLLLLSHGNYSRKILGALRGEMANSVKLMELLKSNQYRVNLCDIFDVFEGQIDEFYQKLSLLNMDLADAGYPLLDESFFHPLQQISENILKLKPDFLFLLSWEWSLAALFASGIQKKCPTASKLYVHQEDSVVQPTLFAPSHLLLTESLLANKKAIEAGIPPWKLIFFPHHYTYAKIQPSRKYLEKWSKKNINKNSIVIGSVARLVYGKNIEFSLEVAKRLSEEGHDILYILKGDLETNPLNPLYHHFLKNLIESIQDEKWFIWDRSVSNVEEMSEIYASFDIFLHLSGKEAGSNVVVEALASSKPCVILEASTNPSLFSNAACFVKCAEKNPFLDFQTPSRTHLYKTMVEMVSNPVLREEFARKAKESAEKRFSPKNTLERMPLILKACHHYHRNSSSIDSIKQEVELLMEADTHNFKGEVLNV